MVDQQEYDKIQPVQPILGVCGYGKHFARDTMTTTEFIGKEFDDMLQTEMEKIEVKETIQLCNLIFSQWLFLEKNNTDMKQYDGDIAKELITQILRKRLQAAEVDIVLPDALILLIMTCTDGNPGQSLLILSDLLESICRKIGKIPAGYVITSKDFSQAFPSGWPIMKMKPVNEQYSQKWKNQKKEPMFSWETDNNIDMVGWWKKFVE